MISMAKTVLMQPQRGRDGSTDDRVQQPVSIVIYASLSFIAIFSFFLHRGHLKCVMIALSIIKEENAPRSVRNQTPIQVFRVQIGRLGMWIQYQMMNDAGDGTDICILLKYLCIKR